MKKALKIFNLFFIFFLFALFFLFIFKGSVYRYAVSYHPLGEREIYPITNTDLLNYIQGNTPKNKPLSVNKIINISLSITSNQLTFSTSRSSANPNRLIYSHKAHCIGYASFYSSVCNYLLKKYNLSDWEAVPKISNLYLFNTNLNAYFDSDFLKDHDFVIIRNTKTGKTFAVDPAVYDYSGIESVSVKE